jgi:hypothetical protein
MGMLRLGRYLVDEGHSNVIIRLIDNIESLSSVAGLLVPWIQENPGVSCSRSVRRRCIVQIEDRILAQSVALIVLTKLAMDGGPNGGSILHNSEIKVKYQIKLVELMQPVL